jgi:2-dehydro-3-deoxyphosphogluconate aldolase/(4S)-4-hydroxy-2-oxoglutarate aldolase
MDRKTEVLQRIQELGLLAVIRAESPEQAVRITDALVAGGVLGIEITFTTPDALGAVRQLADKYGEEIVLGMGTLTAPEQAAAAADAGARFLVSPHTEEVLGYAMAGTGLPVMMGALTPSEVIRARSLGSDVIKVFPGSLFGPKYFKSLRGPYPDLKLMPTGGVSLDNLGDWFAAGAFAVGAGSALIPKDAVREARWEAVTARAEAFTERIERLKTG